MKTLLLLLVLTLSHIQHVISIDTPALSPTDGDGEGIFEVGSDVVIRTQSPTINTMALMGRGTPSKAPTFKPTIQPTTEEFGQTVKFTLPGVDYSPPGTNVAPAPATVTTSSINGGDDDDETTSTYSPSTTPGAEPPAPVLSAAKSAPLPGNGASDLRIGSAATASLVGMVVGCLVLLGFQ